MSYPQPFRTGMSIRTHRVIFSCTCSCVRALEAIGQVLPLSCLLKYLSWLPRVGRAGAWLRSSKEGGMLKGRQELCSLSDQRTASSAAAHTSNPWPRLSAKLEFTRPGHICSKPRCSVLEFAFLSFFRAALD